jgi:putative transposase
VVGEAKRPAEADRGRHGRADRHPEVCELKKVVSPESRRKAARHVVDGGLGGVAQACRALSLPSSGYYRVKGMSAGSWKLGGRIVRPSRKHPRYGYRRITALLRREGCQINAKRVARVTSA